MTRIPALAILALAAVGCVGTIGDSGSPDDNGDDAVDDPCEGIPPDGACDGAVLTQCVDGAPASTDCAAQGLACGWLDADGAHGCATECALAGLAEGDAACDGDSAIVRCGGGRVVTDACPDATRCFGGAGPECLTADEACGGVGPQGRCAGDVLTRCDDGWPADTDCAAAGALCAYESDARGYQCLAPGATGAFAVAGRVDYEDRPIAPGTLGAPTPRAARGASVYVIRDADDAELAKAVVSDDGSYTLRYDAAEGASVHVLATTRSQAPWRPLRVQRSSGNTHGLGSASFAAAPQTAIDLLASEANAMAQPFNVFETLVTGMDWTRRWGATSMASLTAQFQAGSGGGSYYDGGSNFLNLGGGDGWDDIVILHEFGHHHQDEYGASDNPGGSHPNPGGDDPLLAWGEGQASYIAIAITGIPHYIDWSSGGGWSVDLEDDIHDASMSASMSQDIYEWMVAQLLWDVGDAPAQDLDGDPVAGDHFDAMLVTTTYFHDPDYVGRGRSGVDLVDWLDGWFWRMGSESCASMRTLVHDWYQFPYDFGGPAACP